ncbi:PP0621 family protein [Ramlibacter sp. PS4R-6]|uniref:PP0621 family protein n=1 Tax=Ramlibacter sp. PS4R-6 TaxID=3133438 RepID=UPI0030B0E12D
MIKILLVIAVVFAVIWFLRGARTASRGEGEPKRPAAPPAPQDMVECPVCRVHLPRADALPGPDGQLYCCAEHRQRAG